MVFTKYLFRLFDNLFECVIIVTGKVLVFFRFSVFTNVLAFFLNGIYFAGKDLDVFIVQLSKMAVDEKHWVEQLPNQPP